MELNTLISKLLKYFSLILGLLYVVGYLTISIRLSEFNLIINDALSIDYLKTGIFFAFSITPLLWAINSSFKYLNEKPSQKLFFSLTLFVVLLLIIGLFAQSYFTGAETVLNKAVYCCLFTVILLIIVHRARKVSFNKIDVMDYFTLSMFCTILLIIFSTTIYANTSTRYGGGKAYKKVLILKSLQGNIIQVNAKIYYESESWIHFEENSVIKSVPKSRILEQHSNVE